MKGIVFLGNKTAQIREFPDPVPSDGEAVVKIMASGLCGTDLHRYRSDKSSDLITGHEPCGVIVELGAGSPSALKVGDRVIVHHYSGCGICEICALGYEQVCTYGKITYGGLEGHGSNAEYILVPSRTLVHLPDQLSFEEGATISCGTGTAINGLNKMGISGMDTVVIFGQGPVGLSGTLGAKAMGSRVIAIDVIPERLYIAKQLGADHIINSLESDPIKIIKEITSGFGISAALETSGNPHAQAQALKSLRPFGQCCFVGMGGGPATLDIDNDVIYKLVRIFGSWTFSKAELLEITRFIVEAKVPLSNLITHRFNISQASEAFKTFDEGKTGKCIFLFD